MDMKITIVAQKTLDMPHPEEDTEGYEMALANVFGPVEELGWSVAVEAEEKLE